jgi:hypothetical protein
MTTLPLFLVQVSSISPVLRVPGRALHLRLVPKEEVDHLWSTMDDMLAAARSLASVGYSNVERLLDHYDDGGTDDDDAT